MVKNLILSGVSSKKYNGVIKISLENKTVKTNLNLPNKEYTLVVKTDEIRVFYPLLSGETYKVDCNLDGNITVLIADGKEGLLYGSQGERIKGYVLLSEYRKAYDKIKVSRLVKIDESVQNDEKTIKTENSYTESEPQIKDIKNDDTNKENEKSSQNDEIISDTPIQKENEKDSENMLDEAVEKGCKEIDLDLNSVSNAVEEKDVDVKTLKKKVDESKEINDEIVYKGDNFYCAVRSQLDEIFVCYPEESKLKTLVKDSKWARIDYENGYYVVGVISENDEVKYICYGIPGIYVVKPPAEVKDIARWLPLDINKPRDEGYWLTYQDAKTGKTLTNDI